LTILLKKIKDKLLQRYAVVNLHRNNITQPAPNPRKGIDANNE